MKYEALVIELKLENRVIGIKRIPRITAADKIKETCILSALNRVMRGETIVATDSNIACKGGCTGLGLSDGVPDVPGGFGYFIASGRGEGFPIGERVKKTPALGEEMLLAQPQNVLDGNTAVELSPYNASENYDTVTVLVNPDQLSALIHIFNYEKVDYDNVIMPMVSGCASIFRLPFGELARGEAARAVIGNADVFSRVHFEKDTFFFTVSDRAFKDIIRNSGKSMLAAPIWKNIKKRL